MQQKAGKDVMGVRGVAEVPGATEIVGHSHLHLKQQDTLLAFEPSLIDNKTLTLNFTRLNLTM